MANLPSRYPDLALHLTDRALTPLITSASEQDQLGVLTDLSNTALGAYESALRLGLGVPQRIMVEHDEGPLFLQAFIRPHSATATATAAPTPLLAHDAHSASAAAPPPAPPTPNGGSGSSSGPGPGPGPGPGSRYPHAPSQNAPRQHRGALALAAESRSAGPSATTTISYLRGGEVSDNNNEEEEEERRSHHHAPFLLGNGLESDDEDENGDTPAMMVGLVVAASADHAAEARRAAARLERVGREIQERWAELQDEDPGPRGRARGDERRGGGATATTTTSTTTAAAAD